MSYIRTILLFWVMITVPAIATPDEFYILLPININTANELTLSRVLVGVGPAKAAAIVAHRNLHGEFKSVNDHKFVKGIGSGTLQKNRGRMTVDQDLF